MKKLLVLFSFSLLAGGYFLAALPAHAATADPCALQVSDFNKIQQVKNDATLSYADELKAELTLRRELLTNTILCAKADAQTLKDNLSGLTIDPAFQNLQLQMAENLDTTINFYGLQLDKVPTAGINATQAIAKDVLAWRESNYAPLAESVSDFILWSQNQSLFSAADNRLQQIDALAKSVPFSDNTELQNDLQAASASLKNAEDANDAAKNSLVHLTYPDPTLNYIQTSLSALSDTYQHFFDIASLVQTLLPH